MVNGRKYVTSKKDSNGQNIEVTRFFLFLSFFFFLDCFNLVPPRKDLTNEQFLPRNYKTPTK